jgi:16S rRNA (guanine(527)-N(7))-methyltransferase RsmG
MPLLEVLERELRRFQLELNPNQISILARYCDELVRWNLKINLTGLKEAELVKRLVVEPAWIAKELKLVGTLADIGSGNGSPAIPLHVVSELNATHLIEARSKRAAFLRHIVNFLKLEDVVVHRTRLEEVAPTELGRLDWVSLQGVALTLELLDAIKKLSVPTTRVVWITSAAAPPVPPLQTLAVPSTDTEVLIFRLDLT